MSDTVVRSGGNTNDEASDEFKDRDCRNRHSPYYTAKACSRPPCLKHPSGTLKYQWHGAYEHLLSGTANRRNSYVVLLGYEQHSRLDTRLAKFVMQHFDERRSLFLDLNLASPEAQKPVRELKQSLTEFVGKERDDRLWYLKDDSVYIELALTVFVQDSHRHWIRRLAQVRSPKDSAHVFEGEPVDDKSRFPLSERSGQKQPQIQGQSSTPARGSTISTAIDVDAIRDDLITSTHSSRGPQNASPTSQASSFHPRLESQRPQAEQISLEAQLLDTTIERDTLRSDNAVLGIALAEGLQLRRNSKAAVLQQMAARTSLNVGVTGRLMENKEFTDRWFPNYHQ